MRQVRSGFTVEAAVTGLFRIFGGEGSLGNLVCGSMVGPKICSPF